MSFWTNKNTPHRTRSAVILLREDIVLLMRRISSGHKYWIFPGGGVEEGETKEEAAKRECLEETTITCEIDRLLYFGEYENKSKQYMYLARYVSGEPKLGEGTNEWNSVKNDGEVYEPKFVQVKELGDLKIFPVEIKEALISDLQNGLPTKSREFNFEVE